MEDLGLVPEDVRSLDDLHKLPFTTKGDLRDTDPGGLGLHAGAEEIQATVIPASGGFSQR